jgi:glutathione synthase/RimK-type ligase-like ATP-grasp enzyme
LTKEDWRVHDDANVRWEQVTIPYELKKSLIMFVKKLNLVWASVDLIKSVSGEYYFLEANRPGAHYWLDMFVGLDITDIISSKIKALLNE